MRILVTGAAGNLGTFVVRDLLARGHAVHALVHRTPLASDVTASPQLTTFRADLSDAASLTDACRDVDAVVHLAGVLFAPRPEMFLPATNVGYVRNLLAAAKAEGVAKFILVSFPHTEGETTPEHPATDRLDREPSVIHFRTRLEAEKVVLGETPPTPIVLRAGVVYGRGVNLTEAARKLLRWRLMAVWRQPTWVHLIALPDFLSAVAAAVEKPSAHGIYNMCDDAPLTLQEFLDELARHWGYGRPWRLPTWCFRTVGAVIEDTARIFGTAAPLTRDIVRAGMTSSVADTKRRGELLPQLAYPTLKDGLRLL